MAQDSRIDRMKELVRILDEASRAYYVENREIMSNLEFDALYDELAALEEEIPAGRFGTAEEAAQVILMLAEAPKKSTLFIHSADPPFRSLFCVCRTRHPVIQKLIRMTAPMTRSFQ